MSVIVCVCDCWLVVVYSISTFVGYLMPNPVYPYVWNWGVNQRIQQPQPTGLLLRVIPSIVHKTTCP